MSLARRKPLTRTPMVKPVRGFWHCRRQQNGLKCGALNPNRNQKCKTCGKRKPSKSKPKHTMVLQTMSYEDFIEISGGETCGICGAPPKAKRLHRDHDHRTGKPRGLLCFKCNSALRDYMTLDWLRAAVAYLEQAVEVVPAGIPEGMCGRILVGQGGDTWDPLCVLPLHHEGVCSRARS